MEFSDDMTKYLTSLFQNSHPQKVWNSHLIRNVRIADDQAKYYTYVELNSYFKRVGVGTIHYEINIWWVEEVSKVALRQLTYDSKWYQNNNSSQHKFLVTMVHASKKIAYSTKVFNSIIIPKVKWKCNRYTIQFNGQNHLYIR